MEKNLQSSILIKMSLYFEAENLLLSIIDKESPQVKGLALIPTVLKGDLALAPAQAIPLQNNQAKLSELDA